MPDQQTCASPVIVTLPAQLDAAAAEQAADRITAAFIPGVRVVIADLTAAACCDRSAIRNLLRAHRKAAARHNDRARRPAVQHLRGVVPPVDRRGPGRRHRRRHAPVLPQLDR